MKKKIILSDPQIQKLSPQKLGDLLINAQKIYYSGQTPLMDDHTYDSLEALLKKQQPYHRFFQKIGSSNKESGFVKRRHSLPLMNSQNKVSDWPSLKKYFQKHHLPPQTSFLVQPKLDGLSLGLEYHNGLFRAAVTRGDGKIGDDISQNAAHMQGFLKKLKKPFSGLIRAEIVISYQDFATLQKKSQDSLYSNPRNAAAGISQRLDARFSFLCRLVPVDLAFQQPLPIPNTESDSVDYLKTLGLDPVDSLLCPSLSEVEKIYQKFLNQSRRRFPFEIDGLVVKINDQTLQESLGILNQRPKGQVAYKFPAESAETTIISISWQVGPLGKITPVAKVKPVSLSGAIIRKASLANWQLIKEKNLNTGDLIQLSRRGDVIPYVEKLLKKNNSGYFKPPLTCPSCNKKLKKEEHYLLCTNYRHCPAQIQGQLRRFCTTLKIDHISQKTIRKFYQQGKLKTPADFYHLTLSDFINTEGLGKTIGQKIINQIQSQRRLSLAQFLSAISIPTLSHKRTRQLVHAGFNTLEKITSLKISDLLAIKGFKEQLAQTIIEGIKIRRPLIDSLILEISIEKPTPSASLPLKNLSFCLTGSMSRPRRELEGLIEKKGGETHSSVSKSLSYLVSNNPHSLSSKSQKAKTLKIPIINEKKLLALLSS